METRNNNRQSTKSMMKTHYGSEKLDKSDELNKSMTIGEKPKDSYTKTVEDLRGGND